PRSGSSFARTCIAPNGCRPSTVPTAPYRRRRCDSVMRAPMKTATKPLFLLLLLLLLAARAGSAAPEPVKWSARLEPADIRAGEGGRVVLAATIEPGWHVYSMKPVEGPFPTQISIAPKQALVPVGKPVQPPGEQIHDPNFGVDV